MTARISGILLLSTALLATFGGHGDYSVLGDAELAQVVGRSDQSKTKSASDACTDLNNQGDSIPPDFCALGLDGQPCQLCLDGSPITRIEGTTGGPGITPKQAFIVCTNATGSYGACFEGTCFYFGPYSCFGQIRSYAMQ